MFRVFPSFWPGTALCCADAYIVVSVGSFVTGVVFTLLGIRYRQYKALHRPFSPDAADKAFSQSLSDDQ